MNVSLDKIAPSVAFSIVGCVLLIIGATGVVPIGNSQLIITNPLITVIIITISIVLILASPIIVWQEIKNNNQKDVSKNANIKDMIDINLSGNWKIYYGSNINKIVKQPAGFAHISQKGIGFTMRIHLHSTKNGNITERVFENIGVIENRQIVTSFRAIHPKGSFMTGSMVIRPSHDGKSIRGGAMFINDDGKVVVDKVIMIRD